MMTKVNKKPTCRGHSKETLNTKKKERTKLKQPKERQNPKKNVLTDSKRQIRPVGALKKTIKNKG